LKNIWIAMPWKRLIVGIPWMLTTAADSPDAATTHGSSTHNVRIGKALARHARNSGSTRRRFVAEALASADYRRMSKGVVRRAATGPAA
jgi:hypothetical protein